MRCYRFIRRSLFINVLIALRCEHLANTREGTKERVCASNEYFIDYPITLLRRLRHEYNFRQLRLEKYIFLRYALARFMDIWILSIVACLPRNSVFGNAVMKLQVAFVCQGEATRLQYSILSRQSPVSKRGVLKSYFYYKIYTTNCALKILYSKGF